MPFTETSTIESITIDPNRGVVVRKVNRILKDGVSINEKTDWYVIAEGGDLTGQDPKVIEAATLAWDSVAMTAKIAALVAQLQAEAAEHLAAKAAADAAKLAAGDAPPVSTEDATVNDLQIRLALTEVGLRTQLEGAVAQADQNTKDWYAYAKKFKRHDLFVLAMAQALQVTDAQLDGLWALAATK